MQMQGPDVESALSLLENNGMVATDVVQALRDLYHTLGQGDSLARSPSIRPTSFRSSPDSMDSCSRPRAHGSPEKVDSSLDLRAIKRSFSSANQSMLCEIKEKRALSSEDL